MILEIPTNSNLYEFTTKKGRINANIFDANTDIQCEVIILRQILEPNIVKSIKVYDA
jgi:hypothetical protein